MAWVWAWRRWTAGRARLGRRVFTRDGWQGQTLPGWVGGVEGEREARRWLVESEPGSGLEESVGWEVPPCWKVALGGGVLPVARGPADGCGRVS